MSQVQTWLHVNMASAHLQAIEGLVEEEALGSYVLVEKTDVLDAIGTFVAAYLATVPEAQHMKPAELQQALTTTFRVGLPCMPGHQYKYNGEAIWEEGGGGRLEEGGLTCGRSAGYWGMYECKSK